MKFLRYDQTETPRSVPVPVPVVDAWEGKGRLTHGMRKIPDGFLVHYIVEDQGAVHARHHVAVNLLGPLNWLCWVDVEHLKIELDKGNIVRNTVNVLP